MWLFWPSAGLSVSLHSHISIGCRKRIPASKLILAKCIRAQPIKDVQASQPAVCTNTLYYYTHHAVECLCLLANMLASIDFCWV